MSSRESGHAERREHGLIIPHFPFRCLIVYLAAAQATVRSRRCAFGFLAQDRDSGTYIREAGRGTIV